jgi:hypothetical protein
VPLLASNVRNTGAAAFLYGSMAGLFGDVLDKDVYQAYRDRLLQDFGDVTDPVVEMMVEQLALAHLNIGRLHVRAANAASVDEAKAYNAAAARLMGEFRRTSLALKAYRVPASPRNVTVVQQNLARGDQQIALVTGGAAAGALRHDCDPDNEVASSGAKGLTHGELVRHPRPEPAARAGREVELVEAEGAHGPWPPAVAAGGPGKPSVGALDRPPDCRRQGPCGG